MKNLDDLVAIARQEWRQHAACGGSGEEFVDPAPADAERLIREFCHRCTVVGYCRAQGDSEAPHRWPVVMGARFYAKGEPVDGWEVA